MNPGEVIAWVAAHIPTPTDDRPLTQKADEMFKALGWHGQ